MKKLDLKSIIFTFTLKNISLKDFYCLKKNYKQILFRILMTVDNQIITQQNKIQSSKHLNNYYGILHFLDEISSYVFTLNS